MRLETRANRSRTLLGNTPGRAYRAHWFDDTDVANSRPNNAWFLISSLLPACRPLQANGKQMLIWARARP